MPACLLGADRGADAQLTSAEVLAELVELSKKVAAEGNPSAHFTPPLSDDELAFYDAVSANEFAVQLQGEDVRGQFACDLVRIMQRDVKTDWTVRDDVRAKLRSSIRCLLVRYKYPPDKQSEAIRLVIEQMEAMAQHMSLSVPRPEHAGRPQLFGHGLLGRVAVGGAAGPISIGEVRWCAIGLATVVIQVMPPEQLTAVRNRWIDQLIRTIVAALWPRDADRLALAPELGEPLWRALLLAHVAEHDVRAVPARAVARALMSSGLIAGEIEAVAAVLVEPVYHRVRLGGVPGPRWWDVQGLKMLLLELWTARRSMHIARDHVRGELRRYWEVTSAAVVNGLLTTADDPYARLPAPLSESSVTGTAPPAAC